MTCNRLDRANVRLLGGIFEQRYRLVREYIASLTTENLLQNHHLEAGLRGWHVGEGHVGDAMANAERHWGWESPSCQVRGQFLGHWLSGASQIVATTGDPELRLRVEAVIDELARCQEKNGRGWVGSTPEKYMEWLAQGMPTWATQYIHHKTLMGLIDAYLHTGSQKALEVAGRFADWFHSWAMPFPREKMDEILDVETGGMLESWADLYGITHEAKYLDLIERYDRSRLFEPVLRGEDILTGRHANTTIPEAQGAARCYEVTGDERWRRITEAYWRLAVTDRGTFATGGQTSEEVWTPPHTYAAWLGSRNQEHCTVYNLIRLADYLFRWTGESVYADYIERNLYNGILAQQNPKTGMVTYYLPLEAGGRKLWGHPTRDFWCCHGSLVQAHPMLPSTIAYADEEGLRLAQYIPSELTATLDGQTVTLRQHLVQRGAQSDHWNRPNAVDSEALVVRIEVSCAAPAEFTLRLRLPEWLAGRAEVRLGDQVLTYEEGPSGWACIRRTWGQDVLTLVLPMRVALHPIPDEPGTVAVVYGPITYAALTESAVALLGNRNAPESCLRPHNAREWGRFIQSFRARTVTGETVFEPLFEVVDEPYTVYHPWREG